MTSSALKMALAYAARGWPMIPLHSPESGQCSCKYSTCNSPAKHPRTEHGLRDASTDRTVIERWFRMWPSSNIGLATGATSGIIVLDIDDLMALSHLEATKGGATKHSYC
jgi:hypothetical protein